MVHNVVVITYILYFIHKYIHTYMYTAYRDTYTYKVIDKDL